MSKALGSLNKVESSSPNITRAPDKVTAAASRIEIP